MRSIPSIVSDSYIGKNRSYLLKRKNELFNILFCFGRAYFPVYLLGKICFFLSKEVIGTRMLIFSQNLAVVALQGEKGKDLLELQYQPRRQVLSSMRPGEPGTKGNGLAHSHAFF